MASPFRAFRKHQKQWLAVLGVLTMFSFVFLPILLDRFGGRSQQSKDTTVVTTTRYGTLRESDMQHLRQQRQTLVGFLNHVATAIRERGGFAQSAMQMMNEVGMADEESTVTSWLLSQRARELGIVVSDKTVVGSIQGVLRGLKYNAPPKDSKDAKPQFSEVRLGTNDLKAILRSLHTGQAQFMEIWRTELMAQKLLREFAFSLDGIPPGQRWDYFQRFSRRATVEVLPVSVEDFVKNQETPDQDTLKRYFDEHKNQLALPGSPDPGFRQPHKIAVEYLKADQNKYVDLTAVTDKEVADYYEQFKDIYYREEPAKPAVTPEPAATKTDEKAAAPKKEETKPAQPAKTPEPPKPATDTKPKDAASAAAKPADKAAEKPAAGKPEQKPATESPAKPASEDKKGPAANKSSSSESRSLYHFASFQAKEDKGAAKPAPSAEKPATKAAEKPAEPAAKPAAKADAPASKAEPAAKPAAAKAEPAAKPGENKAASAPSAVAPAPPKYVPFEKVKEQIRGTLAQRQANTKMQKALTTLQDVLTEYHQKWLNWKVAETTRTKGEPIAQPTPPDLQALAKQHGLVYQRIPAASAWDFKGYDINSSNVPAGGPEAGGVGTPFVAYAFQTATEFRPTISQDTAGNAYLFWKTEDIPERVPSFDDPGIADQVATTWKRVQARSVASKKAEEFKAEADKAQQPLAKLFGTRPGMVVTKTEPFAWLSFGALPTRLTMQESRPQISEIQGVDQPGDQFMRTVFKLTPGEFAVAPNQAETVYYVIRAVDFTPSQDELWKSFRDGADMQSINRVASEDLRQSMVGWMNSLKSQVGLKWEREPYRAQQQD